MRHICKFHPFALSFFETDSYASLKKDWEPWARGWLFASCQRYKKAMRQQKYTILVCTHNIWEWILKVNHNQDLDNPFGVDSTWVSSTWCSPQFPMSFHESKKWSIMSRLPHNIAFNLQKTSWHKNYMVKW